MFCRLLFVPLFFFFWPLYCLTFFDWRLLNTYHFSIFKLFLNSVIVLNSSKFRSRILQCKKEDIFGRHINLKTILKIPNGCVIRSRKSKKVGHYNMTGVTGGAVSAYPYRAHEFTPSFCCSIGSFLLCVL